MIGIDLYPKSNINWRNDKMQDTAIEMAKRMLVDSIWKSANLEFRNHIS